MGKTTKIKDLIPDNKNFNKGTEYGNSLIEKSLRKFGAGRSILIDKNNRIIAGNKTIENAAAIGLEDLQIVESDGTKIIAVKRTDIDLDSKAGRELALADNATAKANIDWDIETTFEVANEFGFDAGEWGIKEEEVEELEAKEDEFDTTPPETPITVLGDLYEIGEHRLLCGDSTDLEQVNKLLNGIKPNILFTDPPYNVAFNGRSGKFDVIENDDLNVDDFKDFINDFAQTVHALEIPTKYIWCNWKFYGVLQGHFNFKACIVWAKNVFGLGRGYRHQHEFCLFEGKLDEGINNESDLWEIAKDKNYVHPTQKPIALAERALNNHKNAQYILDLFGGSGSTMVACNQLKRTNFSMELDPKYCDVIVKRMIKLDPTLSVKRNGFDCKAEFQ